MKNKKKSFRHELLSALILVSILPLIICSLFMTGFFKSRVEKNYEQEADVLLGNITEGLKAFLTEAENINLELAGLKEVREYLKVSDTEQKKYLYQTLYSLTSDIVNVADFALYDGDGILRYTSDEEGSADTLSTDYGILYQALEHPDRMVISAATDYSAADFTVTLKMAGTLTNSSGLADGYIVITVTADGMDEILGSIYSGTQNIYLFDGSWNVFYGSDRQRMKETGLALKYSLMNSQELYDIGDGDRYYVAAVEGYEMYAVLEQHEIFSDGIVVMMYGIALAIAMLCLLLCLAVSYFMSRFLTRPVEELKTAMKDVGEGNLDVRLDFNRGDEFSDMAGDFNLMTQELKTSLEEKIIAQKALDEAHAATMQAQLNPHFLYNTLDTIKWVAKANDVPEIATMSAGLAKILRTSISKERFVTLKEELDFVGSYM